MVRIGDYFSLELGSRRGPTVRVGERELTPLSCALRSTWATPGGYAAGGYAWTYPLAVEVKDGPSTNLRLIPDLTRLALLTCAILGAVMVRYMRAKRGGKL